MLHEEINRRPCRSADGTSPAATSGGRTLLLNHPCSSKHTGLNRDTRSERTSDDVISPFAHMPQLVQHAEDGRARRVPVVLVDVVAGAQVIWCQLEDSLHVCDNFPASGMQGPVKVISFVWFGAGG